MEIGKKAVTVHNLVILDESGSMYSIRQQTVAGLNDTIGSIRSAQERFPEQKHRLAMVTFSSRNAGKNVRYIFDDVPVAEIGTVDMGKYVPEGGTPLYDAMGTALARLETQCAEGDQVLVTVITDGMENSSHEYSGKAICSIVKLLREKGWVFAYIGANQDAVEVASELGIGNAIDFYADDSGTEEMFKHVSECRMSLYSLMSEGEDGKRLQDGFFSEDKD